MLLAMNSEIIRLQCPFLDTEEVERVCDYIGSQRGYASAYLLPAYEEGQGDRGDIDLGEKDPMFEEAAHLVVTHQQGSTSLIQRKLKLGYNRAGRLIDQLEAAGVVGPFEGSKAREVLVPDTYSLERMLKGLEEKT
jgi:S-DNA-T family DNA segregation ATPase FtsK/SpoIIIE